MNKNTFPEIQKRGPDPMKTFKLGPIGMIYGFSNDPKDRLWGHTDENRTSRVRHLISLHYIEIPDGRKLWGSYLGSLCVHFYRNRK
jgi:hypothetical protein